MKNTWVIALDVGATHVSSGLVNAVGQIKLKRAIAAKDEATPLKDRIFSLVRELIAKAKSEKIKPVGIALGVPGIVDTENGVLVVAGNLPELFGLPLGRELNEAFGLPVLLENDVNAQAAGEMVFGVARGFKDFAMLSIGSDLGGGIVINGKLHRGAHNIAAEFGHLTLELDGRPCVCGSVGCAREWTSGMGLAERAAERLNDDSPVLKKAKGHRAKITAPLVFEAANKGDPAAAEMIEEFARRFGAVIANIMKVLDPQLIVLFGEVFLSEPGLIARIVHWARHYYFPLPQFPEFRVSELSKETAIKGPAAAFFIAHHVPAGPGPASGKRRKA